MVSHMELQKVFQEVNRKLAYKTQHPSKKSLNAFRVLFFFKKKK